MTEPGESQARSASRAGLPLVMSRSLAAGAITAPTLRCSPAGRACGLCGTAHQQRVAAGLAGLGVAARAHFGDAVLQPFVARQMLDHDGAGPQRRRRFPEEARQDAILIALDVDL